MNYMTLGRWLKEVSKTDRTAVKVNQSKPYFIVYGELPVATREYDTALRIASKYARQNVICAIERVGGAV